MRPRRLRLSGRTQITRADARTAAANIAVAATVAATAAVLSLVCEDALPLQGPSRFDTRRWTILAIIVALLASAVWWRSTIKRTTGTLFYLRLLDDRMPDLHAQALHAASRQHLALRSITRWIDTSTQLRDGAIDLTDACITIHTALEAAVNADEPDTAFTIAPNLFWPCALAIGAELPTVDNLYVQELRHDLPPDHPSARINLARLPPPDPGLIAIEVRAADSLSLSHNRIGIILALTNRSLAYADVFTDHPVDRTHVIQLAGRDSELGSAQIAALARTLAEAILTIKESAAGKELIIAAAMPKILALALGWLLGQAPASFFARTQLLHHDRHQYRIMRVHAAQTHTPGREDDRLA